MKTKILWLAMAALAITSCSKTESLNNTDTKQLIDFSAPRIGKQIKSPIDGETYPTTAPFGVFSYMLTNNNTWETNKATASTVMQNVEISYLDPVWKAGGSETYYWPADDKSSLSFICYSPKFATGVSYDVSNSDGFTITDYVNDGSTDLMYSNEIANQKYTTASGVVAPQFNHALTQVYFVAQTAGNYSADATVTIKSIKLNDIISKGTFKANPATTPTWTLDGATKATYTAYENSTGVEVTSTETKVGDALVMLPQGNLASQPQKITVVYELSGTGIPNPATVTKELVLTGEWARNAKIKYLLTITLTEVVYSPMINGWSPESNGTTN